jgi:hypothetical protein
MAGMPKRQRIPGLLQAAGVTQDVRIPALETRQEQARHHVIEMRFVLEEGKKDGFEVVMNEEPFAANLSVPEAPDPYSLVVVRKA